MLAEASETASVAGVDVQLDSLSEHGWRDCA